MSFTYNLHIIITDADSNIIINPTLLTAIKSHITNGPIKQNIPFKIIEPSPAWEYTISWTQVALPKPDSYLMGDLFTDSHYLDYSIIYEHTKVTLGKIERILQTNPNSPINTSVPNSYSWEMVEEKEFIESKKCSDQNNRWKIAFQLWGVQGTVGSLYAERKRTLP